MLVGVVAVLSIGVGFTVAMGNASAGELLFARGLFMLAAVAVAAAYIYWLYNGERPISARVIVGVLVGGLVFAGLPEALRWINSKDGAIIAQAADTNAIGEGGKMADEKKETASVNVGGSGNIVTINQSGGTNVINQAPKPQLKRIEESIRQNPDGSQTASLLVEVDAPYPAGSLLIKAIAPDILDLEAVPQRTGVSFGGHSGKREGYAFTTLISPFGRYMIKVRTAKPEAVSIEYEFQ